jgi:cytochrome c556
MKRAALACAVLAALLTGCTRQEPQPYLVEMPMKEIMGHVVDPAADMIWTASGYEITEAGERDLSPTTDEGWLAVENGATIVAESANLLMLPGRAPEGDETWTKLAAAMAKEAMVAKVAAQEKSKDRLFEAGASLYQSCVACHDKYIPK